MNKKTYFKTLEKAMADFVLRISAQLVTKRPLVTASLANAPRATPAAATSVRSLAPSLYQ